MPSTTKHKADLFEPLARLAASLGPLTFAREVLQFFPDPPQAWLLKIAPSYREIALNCSRQWGKSTIVAILLLHRLLTVPGTLVLVVGPGARQSGELVEKVKRFLHRVAVPYSRYSKQEHSALLPNGSAIIGLPAVDRKIRGFSSVSILVIDEAAWVPDDVCFALLPALAATRGDLFVLSTPHEKRGFFYRMMTEDAKGRLRYTGPVTECPRIEQDFLDQERARGEAYFQREYLCQFLETGRFLISSDLARAAVNVNEEAWTWL